jgi:hypothetical protein
LPATWKAQSATHVVSPTTALQSAINSASPSNVLVLQDGAYTSGSLNLSKDNIIVTAATPGGVLLKGAQKMDVSRTHEAVCPARRATELRYSAF